jgi:hypothetical protein
MRDPSFLSDMTPVLSASYVWEPRAEAAVVRHRLIERLLGAPWKKSTVQ